MVKKADKSLAVAGAQALATMEITKEDIKKYFCEHADEKELFMCLGIVQSLNLDPHKREVYFIKYSKTAVLQIVVGYEVYLKRAERTGKLDGWECGITTDGKKAWIKIHRKDRKVPFYWEVILSEFNKKQSTWNQIPTFMGKKVVIAQGFRLCFPDELGGMPYTQEEHSVYDIKEVTAEPSAAATEEMPESTDAPAETSEASPEPTPPPATNGSIISEPQRKRLFAISKTAGWSNEEVKSFLMSEYTIESTKLILRDNYEAICNHVESHPVTK